MSSQQEQVVKAIEGSPYARRLGIRVEPVSEGIVRARLPWDPGLATVGDQVHGGALSSLVDVAATAAAWCTRELPEHPRGTTIGFQIQFLSGARAEEVVAEARVISRGRSITVIEVEGRAPDGRPVVRALVTYKLSGDGKVAEPAQILTALFAGKSLAEQKALLATLERAGAGLYRGFAAAEPDPDARAALQAAVEREEANARLLEGGGI